MDLVYVFRVLYERKFILIASAIIAAAAAYFFTRNEKKFYRSTAQLSTGYTINDDIQVGGKETSLYEADTKFNNDIITFTSPSVTTLLSYQLILHDLQSKHPFTELNEAQKKSPVYTSVNKDSAIRIFKDKLETMTLLTSYRPDEKKMIEFLKLYGYDYKFVQRSLSVYRLQRTDYIQIDYISQNPELSSFAVNTIFSEFIRYYKYVRSTKSNEAIDTLRSLMEKKRQELSIKTGTYINEAGVDPTIESTSKLEVIANLENMLADEKKRLTTLNANLEKVMRRINDLKPEGTTSISTGDNMELLTLRKQRDDTYAEYVRTGSTNQALYQQYLDLKSKIQKAALQGSGGSTRLPTSTTRLDLMDQKADAEIDIQTSQKNISEIEKRIASLKGGVRSSASQSATAESLTKEVEQANKEYLEAKQKYNDAIDINSSSVNNFRQILFGQPALDPEPSKRKLIVGMAGIAALLTVTLVIIILTYLDSSIKTPRQFNKEVNLKLISTINFMNLQGYTMQDIITNKIHTRNKSHKSDHNAFRASLRKLRFEIEQSNKQVFLFASTKKAQGKTTIIQALSFSLALSKKKILIIDTNFCNNDLTLQLQANPVLERTNVQNEPGAIMDELEKNATVSSDGYVYVIGSEGGDYTPEEILSQQNVLNYLSFLKTKFDYIFLEGPPLNDFSDSRELSQYVEGVIAVFSADISLAQIDKQSIDFFKSLGNKFDGAVLNKVELKSINTA